MAKKKEKSNNAGNEKRERGNAKNRRRNQTRGRGRGTGRNRNNRPRGGRGEKEDVDTGQLEHRTPPDPGVKGEVAFDNVEDGNLSKDDEYDEEMVDVGTQECLLLQNNGGVSPPTPPPASPCASLREEKKSASPPPPPLLPSPPSSIPTTLSSTPIILLKNDDKKSAVSSKSTKTKKEKEKKKKKSHSPSRAFNRSVRQCVENSDPHTLTSILRDPAHHSLSLDKHVLETVMKAYVTAAMFDDALYCLIHNVAPGTLSPSQSEKILMCLPQNLRNSSAYTASEMIDALAAATDFSTPALRSYFLRIVRGISLEFLEEATAARDRICSVPCERLVRSVQCVVDASLKRGKKPSDLVVIPGNQLGVFIAEGMDNRGIQAGDAVSLLPYAGPYPMSAESLDRNMIEATVTSASPLTLRLQDRGNANLYAMLTDPAEGNVYRVDKLANRMGYNRQLAACVGLVSDEETVRCPSPELVQAIASLEECADDDAKTNVTQLCSALVAEDDSEKKDMTEEERRFYHNTKLSELGALDGLNSSQRYAVLGAALNRLTLVQGPPGTGKTAVAIRILQHWARTSFSPILASSDSNIAVDNLVEGCAAIGLRVVRLGRPEAIRPELLPYCIDRPQTSNYNGVPYRFEGATAMSYRDKLKSLKNAQVVCCTCIGSGGEMLDSLQFSRVLIDEATQATEPATLVPLVRGCRQLVLIGDHCQLPPTVLSPRAEEEGLSTPLFSRLVAGGGVPPFMLDTQYRMHPAIATFPSDLFYGGKLRNGVSPPERRPLAGFPWPREEFPVAFVPVDGTEMDDGVSKLNQAEAAAACDAVAALLSGGQCSAVDIAVVTPYAAQVRLIRRLTRQLVQRPPYVEVSSTDGFQGREKEAVVFSAVRSNDYGAIGFVSDWRRINVSFTRARRGLIVIGNEVTLRRGDPETWMPWLAWADAQGINMDKPGIPRGRYDPEQLRRVRGGMTMMEHERMAQKRRMIRTPGKEQQEAEEKKNSSTTVVEPLESTVKASEKEKVDLTAVFGDGAGCWDDSGCWDDWEEEGGVGINIIKEEDKIEEEETEVLDAWDL